MPEGWKRRALVVEDHPLMRALVTDTLEHAGFTVRAVGTSPEALAAFASFDPDVLITDIDLGVRPNGIELAHLVHADGPDVAIVVLSNFPGGVFPAGADAGQGLGAGSGAGGTVGGQGARGLPDGAVYLNKASLDTAAELVDAVEGALHGRLTGGLEQERSGGADPRIAALTAHQLDVLGDIAAGWSNAEIANRRSISLRAVEKSVGRIFASLGIASDTATTPRVVAAAIYMSVFGVTPSTEHAGRGSAGRAG
ncbi:response regulator transcription factor [Plantibacter sp. YIM 135249]|uniref:response regulator transcription factor n=1 Tax=Plantibacter sp. YIM 135249 TaxID=3423918 RepID=UPI003D336651